MVWLRRCDPQGRMAIGPFPWNTPTERERAIESGHEGKNKKTNKRMAESLVSMFEGSNSFAEAKYRANLLSHSTHWDDSMSLRIADSITSRVHDPLGTAL